MHKAFSDARIMDTDTFVCNRALLKGCQYQKGLYVAYSCDTIEGDVYFGKIVAVLIYSESDVYLLAAVVLSE
jgi:hypothetical protein